MAAADHVGPTGQTVEQQVQPGYPQHQLSYSDVYTNSKIHRETFPEALNEIAEAGPGPAVGRVQLAVANINPVPVIQEHAAAITNHFTVDSHELAHESTIEGAIQLHGDGDPTSGGVRDIGWHKPNVEIPDPLIGGLSNGQLFAMVRRFNKVTTSESHPLQGLLTLSRRMCLQ